MTKNDIELYLNSTNTILEKSVLEEIERFRKQAINDRNECKANYFWCIRQIYIIQSSFLNMFNLLKNKKFEKAWNLLERTGIELSFLEKNFENKYSLMNDSFHLAFIKKMIKEYEKLFPYQFFTSREGIIKKEECSICGQVVSIRKPCGHKIGKLYMGELCTHKVIDYELIGISIVTDPFDKYTVLHPEGLEYNYQIIELLMPYLTSPYDKWYIDESKVIKPEYRNIGRNTICPCGSLKKYKNCCLNSEKKYTTHYRINLLFIPQNGVSDKEIIFTSTWK